MRDYSQFCGLARALDVVGERWTMLILRELAIRPCRYTDLRDGLPGIATNLLADRLRDLENNGVITRTEAPPPIATSLYDLSDHGRLLVPLLVGLTRWGAPLVAKGKGDDEFRGRWLVITAMALYGGVDTAGIAPLSVAIRVESERVLIEVTSEGTTAGLDASTEADVTLEGDPERLMAALSGEQTLKTARTGGLIINGTDSDIVKLQTFVNRANVALQHY